MTADRANPATGGDVGRAHSGDKGRDGVDFVPPPLSSGQNQNQVLDVESLDVLLCELLNSCEEQVQGIRVECGKWWSISCSPGLPLPPLSSSLGKEEVEGEEDLGTRPVIGYKAIDKIITWQLGFGLVRVWIKGIRTSDGLLYFLRELDSGS